MCNFSISIVDKLRNFFEHETSLRRYNFMILVLLVGPSRELLKFIPVTLYQESMCFIVPLGRHMDAVFVALCINKCHHIRPYCLLAILLLLWRHDNIGLLRSVGHVKATFPSPSLKKVGSTALPSSSSNTTIGLAARAVGPTSATLIGICIEVVAVCTTRTVDVCAKWSSGIAAEAVANVSALFRVRRAAASCPESEFGSGTERCKNGKKADGKSQLSEKALLYT